MYTDYTYQDWLAASDTDRIAMLEKIVRDYKASDDFKSGLTANEYFRTDNTEVRNKMLMQPRAVEYKDKDGNTQRYRGGRGLSKQDLMSSNGIVAAIDDGLLNIGFKVLSFETVFYDNMGNAKPMNSDGTNFSARQKDMMRNLSRGKRFYISHVKAVGPDNVERLLPTTLEVIIN